jgi:hypothetical protein
MDRMTFEEILRSRAHRMHRVLDCYHPVQDKHIIGIYDNSPAENITLTLTGLHLGERFVGYAQMEKADILMPEDNNKRAAETMILTLRTGDTISFSVTGGTDRTRDIWAFYTFLMQVIADYRTRFPDHS